MTEQGSTSDETLRAFLDAVDGFIEEWRGRITLPPAPSEEEWDAWCRALAATPDHEDAPPTPDKRSLRERTVDHALNSLVRVRDDIAYALGVRLTA
jgi:hypothetical protein